MSDSQSHQRFKHHNLIESRAQRRFAAIPSGGRYEPRRGPVPMGNAFVNAMTFFVWPRARAPRSLASVKAGREGSAPARSARYSFCVSGLNKTQAEDLLDWLDATGHTHRELSYTEGKGFSVSYS